MISAGGSITTYPFYIVYSIIQNNISCRNLSYVVLGGILRAKVMSFHVKQYLLIHFLLFHTLWKRHH